jgi:hypothetical protein
MNVKHVENQHYWDEQGIVKRELLSKVSRSSSPCTADVRNPRVVKIGPRKTI